jgi:glyoxylase-like metal-dependent hydrolase (beta-lactamase superfamily II)
VVRIHGHVDAAEIKVLSAVLPHGGVIEHIGDLQIVPVFDGYSREHPSRFYVTHPEAPYQRGQRPEDWDDFSEFLDGEGFLEHGLGGFLVRSDDHLVLIDTGVGPGQIGPYGPFDRVITGGELPQRLAELEVDPRDITDVVLTHLHPDHYGWATAGGATMFSRATFRCHALDWDHFVTRRGASAGGFAAQLASLTDRLECWDHDGPLLPGIDTQHAPGHTPGSTMLVLSSGGARGLLLGDVVHCPVELVDAEWASLGDVDRDLAMRTREALARELEGSSTVAAGPHFPGMRFGRLLGASGRRMWLTPSGDGP